MNEVICLSNFLKFKCKCGECRNTCCKFWQITLNEDEYYQIMARDYPIEMKDKVEDGIEILPHPTKERYAALRLDFFGNCKMLDEKGLCSLQVCCGEKALPHICVNYPRSNRILNKEEVALSTSCEGVIDLLLNGERENFIHSNIDSKYVILDEEDFNKNKIEQDRNYCISIMLDESISIEERLNKIKEYLSLKDIELNFAYFNDLKNTLLEKDLYLSNHEFDLNANIISKQKTFNLDIQNILVNHMFYMNFPYNEENEKLNNYIGLVSVFYMVKYVLSLPKEKSIRVDILVSLFRVFEHTNFYYNARVIYEKNKKK